VKTFTATKRDERSWLGDEVTAWMRAQQPPLLYPEIRINQSSDEAFHCLTITVIAHQEVPETSAVVS
jgi:hypothetical protein